MNWMDIASDEDTRKSGLQRVKAFFSRHWILLAAITCFLTMIAGGVWVISSPVFIVQDVMDYGVDVISLWHVWALCFAFDVCAAYVLTGMYAQAFAIERKAALLIVGSLMVVTLSGPLVFPPYSGPGGIDYIGAAIGAEFLHLYGGWILMTLCCVIVFLCGIGHRLVKH